MIDTSSSQHQAQYNFGHVSVEDMDNLTNEESPDEYAGDACNLNLDNKYVFKNQLDQDDDDEEDGETEDSQLMELENQPLNNAALFFKNDNYRKGAQKRRLSHKSSH